MNERIGPYEVIRELGRGGMGVVYLANDTRLDRQVAIKALPTELASDPARLERFEREAKTLASLNHPNLAGIYGVEEQDGARYLILEYVEGETLEHALDRGPLSVEDAIELAVQIAAGVEAAHDAGVVHRDLKPANIIVCPDDRAKVLDFGLARIEESGSSTGAGDDQATLSMQRSQNAPQHSPTIEGAILGTAAYMSPEQARGRRVDKRTDIWSFGVVLYEMLTGQSPFRGETASDSIGAVLHKNLDLTRLPRDTPERVQRVLRRCLQRDKTLRYRDIGDVRIELLSTSLDADAWGGDQGRRGVPLWGAAALALVCASVVFGLAVLMLGDGGSVGEARVARDALVVDIAAPEGYLIERRQGRPLFSPDGQRLLLVVAPVPEAPGGVAGVRVPCVVDLRTGESVVFEQFPDATIPLWHDGGARFSVGTSGVDGFKVVVVDSTSGRVEHSFSGDLGAGPMGMWNCDNGLALVAARGLELVDTTTGEQVGSLPFMNDADRGGSYPAWPCMLPDGEHYLYTMMLADADAGLYLGSRVDGSQRRILPNEAVRGIYRDALDGGLGWLYWSLEDAIFRQRLDVEAGALVGSRETVAEGVWSGQWPYHTPFDVAKDGRLVYPSEPASLYENEMVRLDVATLEESPMGILGSLWNPILSSDGRLLLLDVTTNATAGDIFVIEPGRGNLRTLISGDTVNETFPIWVGRENNRIVFAHDGDIFMAYYDGREPPRRVASVPDATLLPLTATPDGGTVLLTLQGRDINSAKLFDLESETLRDWLNLPLIDARILPNGGWVALSTPSVINQIELRRFPEGTGRVVVDSGDVGRIELSEDGRWLFYQKDADLYRVSLGWAPGSDDASGGPTIGTPERLFSFNGRGYREFDVSADGSEVIAVKVLERRVGGSIRLSVPGG